MSGRQTTRLAAVTHALYLRELQRMQPLMERESTLRAQLSALDKAVVRARATATDDLSLRLSGADLLWCGWESRNRSRLNAELAQVVAGKLAAADKLRLAFGRDQAVTALEKAAAERKRQRAEAARAAGLLAPCTWTVSTNGRDT